MKTSEALLEFLVPGMVFWAAILIGRFPELTIGSNGTSFGAIEAGGAALLLGLMIPLGYLTGTLFSEIGTILIGNSTDRFVGHLLKEREGDLAKVEIIKNVDGNYRKFSALRAACRQKSGAVIERLKSHESLLRMYRPASVSVPLVILFIPANFAFGQSDQLSTVMAMSVAVSGLVGALLSWLLIRKLFLQRIESCFHSCVNTLISD